MISQEIIDRATHTDLIAYCNSKNIALKREGNEYILKDNDSVYISIKEPFRWYRHSTQQGGKAIDFCIKFLNMDFKSAVADLTNTSLDKTNLDYSLKRTEGSNIEFSDNQRRIIAYLSKKRKIGYKTVCECIQRFGLRQDNRGNCVFPIRDFDNQVIADEIVGTGDVRFKQIFNEQNGFGFTIRTSNTVDYLYFFESAIDLLSFYDIYKHKIENALLISMGGLKTVVVENYIEHYQNTRILFCIDNDKAAYQFADKFNKKVIPIPKGKDWNEYLQTL